MTEQSSWWCIVCGRELTPQAASVRCPNCGWTPETLPQMGHPPPMPESKKGEGPAVAAATPRPSSTQYPSQPIMRLVPPLVDVAFADRERYFGLSEAMGGKAASLTIWSRRGRDLQVLLAIEKPIGLGRVASGDPIVVSGKGISVMVTAPKPGQSGRIPETTGHKTGWSVSCYAVNPAGTLLALGVPLESAVRGLATEGFEETWLLRDLPASPTALAFSLDGRRLAVGLDDGRSQVLDLASGRVVAPVAVRHGNEGLPFVAPRPGGGWAAVCEDNVLLCWDAHGAITGQMTLDLDVSALAVDPLSNVIGVGGREGHARVWTADLAECLVNQRIHGDRIMRVLLRGNVLTTAPRGGEVQLTTFRCP